MDYSKYIIPEELTKTEYTNQKNTISEAFTYALDIVNGNTPSCKDIKRSCERFLEQWDNPPDGFKTSTTRVNHFLWFCNQFKHFKGSYFVHAPLVLLPWQVLLAAMMYGFWKPLKKIGIEGVVYKRMAQNVMIHVPRKNGKSTLTSVIGLYELRFGEAGAEVLAMATQRDQAQIVFDSAKNFISTAPQALQDQFVISSKDIQKRGDPSAVFKTLSRDTGKSGDGKNVSLVLIDEAAAIEDPDAITVLSTATAARASFMLIYLTSGGYLKTTKFYEDLLAFRLAIHNPEYDSPHLQGLAYTVDDVENWDKEENWLIASPSLGVYLPIDEYRKHLEEAKRSPSFRNAFLSKMLNIYTSSQNGWVGDAHWVDPQNIVEQLPEVEQSDKFIGVDLSMTDDLTAISTLHRTNADGKTTYYFSIQYFIPRETFNNIPSHLAAIYQAAQRSGVLTVQPGKAIDLLDVTNYILNITDDNPISLIGYDRWNSTSMIQQLERAGLSVFKVNQSLSGLNATTKEFEMAYFDNRIKHTHCPFTTWQLNNCEKYVDKNANIKITKGDDKGNKIDGPISALIAMAASAERPYIESSNFQYVEIDIW